MRAERQCEAMLALVSRFRSLCLSFCTKERKPNATMRWQRHERTRAERKRALLSWAEVPAAAVAASAAVAVTGCGSVVALSVVAVVVVFGEQLLLILFNGAQSSSSASASICPHPRTVELGNNSARRR